MIWPRHTESERADYLASLAAMGAMESHMETIIGLVLEVALRGLGLWVLKVLTFGRYKDTNSYLYYLPTLVGFLFITLVILLILVIFAVSKDKAPI